MCDASVMSLDDESVMSLDDESVMSVRELSDCHCACM
jgi:hypothetical protein